MDNIKYVVENSSFVKINKSKVLEFVKELEASCYQHWSSKIALNLTEEKWILLVFIIESMNFCFWKKPKWTTEYNNDIFSGSNALFYSIIKEVECNSNFLDITYLYNLTKDDLLNIFQSVKGEVPYLDERYNCFKEVINYIYNNDKFYNDLFSIKTDLEMLEYITSNISCFDDKSLYKDKLIKFNKRATLLVNDLFYVSNTVKINLGDVNKLNGCADYGIPRTFRDYGILKYSPVLCKLIDEEKEILHDSEMEIEIRANMLYAIELIKMELKKKNMFVNSVELDNLIWLVGKNNTSNKSNVHHTVTIFY